MTEHTSKQFDAELEAVRTRVLQMGGLVEEQIRRAIDTLFTGNMEEIERVKQNDHRVNAMEVELDEACSHIIARRQPAAGDLRLLVAVIKTITDLERIGDEAQKIARMAKLIHTADRQHMPRLDLSHVADRATAMLRQSLDAFARLDVSEAMRVVTERERILQTRSKPIDSNGLEVTVEDSGTGIELKNMERIFNAFFTTKSSGMGMGLAICRSVVEAHGGTLSVSQAVPRGAAFRITLPGAG